LNEKFKKRNGEARKSDLRVIILKEVGFGWKQVR